ncbi:hypothetical protein COE35_22750 [Priestia megaterium]|nr:hypothetical protein COI96_04700 [Priestia megaterium]PFQ81338.1 hypothetical protein COK11_18020 [Priestia megaterium]PGY48297.1 hypothetical protein COE35_22750 [Priestia megaterium]PMD08432.1 hypothetical protein CJ194_20805 [Priestia megaterium]TJZ40789.1 hypothetical protein FA002_04200 [Priestia megaterium]
MVGKAKTPAGKAKQEVRAGRNERLGRKSTAVSQAIYTGPFIQFVRPFIYLYLNLFLVSESDQIKKKSLDKIASVKIR